MLTQSKKPALSFPQCVFVVALTALQPRPTPCGYGRLRARQNGVVMMIALIVLVAMTLAGIALIRSVDTTNVIAGNLAFQQVATHESSTGIEAAITWLKNASSTTLEGDNLPGYLSTQEDPGGSWDDFWTNTLDSRAVHLAQDPTTLNAVSYVIHRMCAKTGAITSARCSFAPSVCVPNYDPSNPICVKTTPQVYYRITARVVGPRNTTSYVQSIIAM